MTVPSAQEQMLVYDNPKIPVYIGDINYQPLTKGQIQEVQGVDISLCKVKKNGEQIKQAFDRGAEIAVQVY